MNSTRRLDFSPQEAVSLNGEQVQKVNGMVGAFSPAISFASCVFETVRGYVQTDAETVCLFRLYDHIDRLLQSARALNFAGMPDRDILHRWICETAASAGECRDVHIRINAFLDNQEGRLASRSDCHVAIKASHRPSSDLEAASTRCTIGKGRRAGAEVFPGHIKCAANYAVAQLCLPEALNRGFKNVLLLAQDGDVAEGIAASFFAVSGGTLLTPPLDTNILPGITRASIIQIARESGLTVHEERIVLADLGTFDEAFLCSTGKEIEPILEIEGHFEARQCGPVTRRVAELYEALVRSRDPRRPDWYSPIYGAQ